MGNVTFQLCAEEKNSIKKNKKNKNNHQSSMLSQNFDFQGTKLKLGSNLYLEQKIKQISQI